MTRRLTHGKTAAECGYTPPGPLDALADLRRHVGLAEGHLAAVHRLLRDLEHHLDAHRESELGGAA